MSTLELPPLSPWQARMHAQAVAALDGGRLGHGLLFCGPARLGKRALAERLARRILCHDRDPAGEACGRCRSCLLFAHRDQRDPLEVRPDGSPSHPWGHAGHPDLMLIGHEINDKTGKPRTEIVIEQIRRLSEKLALTPQYGGAQIAILDPADAINHAACNALLKTLEEPQPGRYLWLISADPARLPATIRSRCQRLEFRLPPAAEALAWLRAQGHAEAAAREALEAARGHPGLAEVWLRDGGLALRREVADDLQALGRGQRSALETAQRWAAAGDADPRLRHAADLALAEAARLTDPAGIRTLAGWFDAANRTRDLLRTTVRADLALAELLAQWRGAASGGASSTTSGGRA
jgi:DNA polymerase-3 subunit delta'